MPYKVLKNDGILFTDTSNRLSRHNAWKDDYEVNWK